MAHNFKVGDKVEVTEGNQAGRVGTITMVRIISRAKSFVKVYHVVLSDRSEHVVNADNLKKYE